MNTKQREKVAKCIYMAKMITEALENAVWMVRAGMLSDILHSKNNVRGSFSTLVHDQF